MFTPRLLSPADIDAAMRLKEAANWNRVSTAITGIVKLEEA